MRRPFDCESTEIHVTALKCPTMFLHNGSDKFGFSIDCGNGGEPPFETTLAPSAHSEDLVRVSNRAPFHLRCAVRSSL